jgi:hypothetical protein
VTTPGSVILDENSVTLRSIALEVDEQPASKSAAAINAIILFITFSPYARLKNSF